MRGKVMDELKRHFRPEFLNRIDEVIVFHQLSREEVTSIVDLMMRRVVEQLKAKDIALELTDNAKALLAERGYDPALGARPLRRTIQRLVEDPLSEKLLWKEFSAGQMVIIDAAEDEIVFNAVDQSDDVPPVPPVELAGSSND
jgi:ATP-dependent Clp protease ATP-binding subunit ClpC